MLISGFQKLTLLDYHGKIASMIFTQGCLFRCPYCHNPELLGWPEKPEYIPEDEVLAYLKAHGDMLDGLVITGGEPTLHKDLGDFMHKVKGLGLSVKLDTNGARPEMVASFIKEGIVDYIAMDLKHVWRKYNVIARAKKDEDWQNCKKTFEIIQNSDIPHEFRTTILPGFHEEEDFYEMAGYLLPGEIYFLQDINYKKTLEENLPRDKHLDIKKIIPNIRSRFPQILVDMR